VNIDSTPIFTLKKRSFTLFVLKLLEVINSLKVPSTLNPKFFILKLMEEAVLSVTNSCEKAVKILHPKTTHSIFNLINILEFIG
jgi:hypothetical protein